MMHYVRAGSGKPLFLIHGFLGTWRIFEEVMPKLALHYDVIAVDLPGQGKSDPDEDTKSVEHYAEAVLALQDELGIDQAVWIGHSLGGYIAQSAVERYPERLHAAVFAYATAVGANEELASFCKTLQQEVIEHGVGPFSERHIPRFFAERSDPKQIGFAIEVAKESSAAGILAALSAIASHPDQVETLKQATLPMLEVVGLYDHLQARYEAKSSYLTRVETPTSHMGFQDDPDLFASILMKWLDDRVFRSKVRNGGQQ
ncbi:alpha/beta fold hydrolase [Paenibacillus sp. DMB20]|uniref:alpha/beta fold hydrolase n=1 Tax=Paenibacillus sp. DMB20 TaxID=1642570 RepID=UPI00069A8EF5|nr:alpha/beta hydrolase [Paenibacillus sp. DMB20]